MVGPPQHEELHYRSQHWEGRLASDGKSSKVFTHCMCASVFHPSEAFALCLYQPGNGCHTLESLIPCVFS